MMNRREFAKAGLKRVGAIAIFPLADRLARAAVATAKPKRRIIDNDEYVKEESIQGDVEFRSGTLVDCNIHGTVYCLTSAPKQMLGCMVKAPKGRAACVWISEKANIPTTRIEYNYFFNDGDFRDAQFAKTNPYRQPTPAASATGSAREIL